MTFTGTITPPLALESGRFLSKPIPCNSDGSLTEIARIESSYVSEYPQTQKNGVSFTIANQGTGSAQISIGTSTPGSRVGQLPTATEKAVLQLATGVATVVSMSSFGNVRSWGLDDPFTGRLDPGSVATVLIDPEGSDELVILASLAVLPSGTAAGAIIQVAGRMPDNGSQQQ